jgi:hypothetical protein
MPATTLRYRRVTTVGLASNAINLSSSGAMGHRVQVPMSVADLNSFFRWARYPGAPRAIGHFNAAGASAVGGPTFLNSLEASLGLSFNDMDGNLTGLSFKSSVLDSAADSRLRSDGAITANDWVMAYVLFKCFGSSSYVTNDVIYNLEDAQNMLTNQGVASAVESSLQVDEAVGVGGYIDNMFTNLLAADPMRFFDASGRQPSGLFETNADVSGVGSWNIVLNDVIEIPLQFTFAAPVTVNSVGNTAGELSGNTEPTLMVPAGETFNIRLQLVAVTSADASAAARLAAEAAALQADIIATAQAVVAAAATAVSAAQTAYNLAAAAAAEAASKAAIANTDTARGYATHAAGRAAAALAALNALIALQGDGTTNAAELATIANSLAAQAAADLAQAASNVAAAQAAYNTAAAQAAEAVINSAAAGTQVATDALATAQAEAAEALASLLALQLTAQTAADNAAAAAAAAALARAVALLEAQETDANEASALAAISAEEAQAAADSAAANAADAADAAAAASASSDTAAAAAAQAAAIDAAQAAASAASAAAAAASAADAAAAAADAAASAAAAAAAALAFSTPAAATGLAIAGNATIQCSWTNSASSNPATGISVLLYKAADNTLVTRAQVGATASSYTFTQANTGLTLGISYYFKVETTNSSGSTRSVGSPVSNALIAPVYSSTSQLLAGSTTTSGFVNDIGTDARFGTVHTSTLLNPSSTVVYSFDFTNQCIREYTISTGMVSTYVAFPTPTYGTFINWTIDTVGNIYIIVTKVIYKVDTSKNITVLAGFLTSTTQVDGVGEDATFNRLRGLVIDSMNILYSMDDVLGNTLYCVIRSIQPNGTVTTIGGSLSNSLNPNSSPPLVNATGSSIVLTHASIGQIVSVWNTTLYIVCSYGTTSNNAIALCSFTTDTHILTILSNPTYDAPNIPSTLGIEYTAPFPYVLTNSAGSYSGIRGSSRDGIIYLNNFRLMFNLKTNTIVVTEALPITVTANSNLIIDSSGGIYIAMSRVLRYLPSSV